MVKPSNYFQYACMLAVVFFAVLLPLQAEDFSQSSNIFKFQQKLAQNGNVQAQYKLASMYERGDGVETNIEQAKHWYGLASKAGSKPAYHREVYLKVKQNGFDKTNDAAWLASIKADAAVRDPEAAFLLGQLYHQGLGVKKDLNKSLELFQQVKILGVANVDNEVSSIRAEMDEIDRAAQQKKRAAKQKQAAKQKKAAQQKKVQQKVEKARQVAPLKKTPQTQQQVKKAAPVKKAPVAEQQKVDQKTKAVLPEKSEKRKRYEAVMEKLRLEQQKIDEQQSQVSGDEGANVDDEI